MKLNRLYPYVVLLTLALLAILAFWRRGSEQRVRRAAREAPEQRIEPPSVAEKPVARTRPLVKVPRRVAPTKAPPEPDDEVPADIPSWEGKQLRDYTWEERQEVGLTNEKLFANAGGNHWSVLALNLDGVIDKALGEEMAALSEAYREASQPFAPDDPYENVEKERELLARLERTLKPESLNEEARQSYEFLKQHVEMWQNGEAEKLVDRKIERENDAAKRLAFRARQEQDQGKQFDAPSEDGNK
jgi:hypothetical protein